MTQFLHFNILLNMLINTYFYDSRCIFFFTDSINRLSYSSGEYPIVYLSSKNLNSDIIFKNYGCQNVIIQHENPCEIFRQFESLIKLHSERFNKRKYIFIQGRGRNSGKKILNIFKTIKIRYVSDILLVSYNPKTKTYTFLTHYYKGAKSSKILTLDQWFAKNLTFFKQKNLFPDKLGNQMGREVKLATFTYEPYSIVEKLDGTEMIFMFEFAKKLNLTPKFRFIGDDLWGAIYDNFTGIGLLGSIAEDKADIGFAAIYTWDRDFKFIDHSKPLIRTGVTCLVPAPKLAAGWLTPLHSFSFEMWIAVGISFLLSIVVLFLIQLVETENIRIEREYVILEFYESFYKITRLFLLQSLSDIPKGKVMKYFLALVLAEILLISSSYSSGLSSIMTIARYDSPIETVDDLAKSDLKWGANTDAWLISLDGVKEEKYKKIKERFVVQSDENLTKLSQLYEFGFTIERLPYGHFATGTYIKNDVIKNYRIMEEDIYWSQCIFTARKNSVLLPLLDDLILRVFEAGLVAYWENQVVGKYMDMSVQRMINYYNHYTDAHEALRLKWIHVEGAFAILIFGHTFALFSLLVEVFYGKTLLKK